MKRWLINPWAIGFLVSCIFAFIVTNVFMDSVPSHTYDPVFGKFMRTPNTNIRWRQEGWATTFVGKHNILAIKDIDKNRLPKIAIWGDSVVEALQVPDQAKMAQQLSRMFEHLGKQVLGFAIAHSENSLADYIVDLKEYESLIPNILSHYIVLCNLRDDTLPNRNERTGRSEFVYDGSFRIVESENRGRHQHFYNLLSKYNMRMASYFFGKVTRYRVQLPWNRRGDVKGDKPLEELSYNKLESWDFILGELRKQSSKRITVLYIPYRPAIVGGGLSFEDPQQEDKEMFANICRRHNIGFIDISEKFNNFFRSTNKFPTGFANTFPGRGHLNVDGHRLVAEAIFLNELSRNSLKQ